MNNSNYITNLFLPQFLLIRSHWNIRWATACVMNCQKILAVLVVYLNESVGAGSLSRNPPALHSPLLRNNEIKQYNSPFHLNWIPLKATRRKSFRQGAKWPPSSCVLRSRPCAHKPNKWKVGFREMQPFTTLPWSVILIQTDTRILKLVLCGWIIRVFQRLPDTLIISPTPRVHIHNLRHTTPQVRRYEESRKQG